MGGCYNLNGSRRRKAITNDPGLSKLETKALHIRELDLCHQQAPEKEWRGYVCGPGARKPQGWRAAQTAR